MPNDLQLIVFDLDFTLWDCGGLWVDCTAPPYKKRNDCILDNSGRTMRLYSDIPEILDTIDRMGIPMALASRTEQPQWARELLDLMGYRDRFEYEEIFPSSKVAHFANLHDQSGIDYNEMLFFDDEKRNIIEVGELGVKCIEVTRGVDLAYFNAGLKNFGLL